MQKYPLSYGTVSYTHLDVYKRQGYAVFEAEQIPALGFEGEVVGESIFFCDNFYNATCVSMGNPNCVIMLEREMCIRDRFRELQTLSICRH